MAVFIPEPPDLSQRAGRQEFWEHMVDESGSCSSLAFLGLGQAYVWVQRSVLSVHCLPVCLGTETSQAPPRVLRGTSTARELCWNAYRLGSVVLSGMDSSSVMFCP